MTDRLLAAWVVLTILCIPVLILISVAVFFGPAPAFVGAFVWMALGLLLLGAYGGK